MGTTKFRIYFSDFFEVSPDQLRDYGAFNISLISDLPLFIDPFLLFNSENPTYQELHDQIIEYVKFLKTQSAGELPDGLIANWFYFPEIKENWLGYSKTGNSGRGLGRVFASSLKRNLTTIFKNFGEESVAGSHLEKLSLVKKGVGKDQISDFTCNLICGYLASFTESFARKYIDPHKLAYFPIRKAEFNKTTQTWNSKRFLLPKYGNQFVLLTPLDILTKDESWINYRGLVDDFNNILNSVSNEQLRSQIDHYFKKILRVDANKEAVETAIGEVVSKFPEILDWYIAIKERNKVKASELSAEKIDQTYKLFVEQLTAFVHLLDDKTRFYKTGINSYEEGMHRISYLKHVIENQDGYRLFYLQGRPLKREQDLQIMFKLTWFASVYDANAEVNNGRGPADFIVSFGGNDKTVVEFKLASNPKLEDGLKKQAEIYTTASRATHPPIKVILYFLDRELAKVNKLLIKHKLLSTNDIVLIDARPNKKSGSKA